MPDEKGMATGEEVHAAIEELIRSGEYKKLLAYARRRVQMLGLECRWASGNDLYAEAVESALGGALFDAGRRWRPQQVSFFIFLRGAIQSISSNYARSRERRLEKAMTPLPEPGETLHGSLADLTGRENPEQELLEKEILDFMEGRLIMDLAALAVFHETLTGCTKKDICAQLGLTDWAYYRAMKVIRIAFDEATNSPILPSNAANSSDFNTRGSYD